MEILQREQNQSPAVKICGNRFADQSRLVASREPDFMGWIFSPKSPRQIPLSEAAGQIREIHGTHPGIRHVGVFAENSLDEILHVAREIPEIRYLQSPGSPEFFRELRKALKKEFGDGGPSPVPVLRLQGPLTEEDLDSYRPAPFFVFDTYVPGQPGGTGKRFPPEWVKRIDSPFLLAGGLRPGNLREVLAELLPFGVDVSSGIESAPGKKDEKALQDFLNIVRGFGRKGRGREI